MGLLQVLGQLLAIMERYNRRHAAEKRRRAKAKGTRAQQNEEWWEHDPLVQWAQRRQGGSRVTGVCTTTHRGWSVCRVDEHGRHHPVER